MSAKLKKRTVMKQWASERQRQSCKNCGVRDGLNFNVRDSVWLAVVPERLQHKVVCLACFDRFAARKRVDYRRSIRVIYFAGLKASFTFRATSQSLSRKASS